MKQWRSRFLVDNGMVFVQLAPWAGYPEGNVEGIWEAQLAALSISHTGLVVTTELVPNVTDIDPNQKKEVRQPLALWALAKTHGQDELVYIDYRRNGCDAIRSGCVGPWCSVRDAGNGNSTADATRSLPSGILGRLPGRDELLRSKNSTCGNGKPLISHSDE